MEKLIRACHKTGWNMTIESTNGLTEISLQRYTNSGQDANQCFTINKASTSEEIAHDLYTLYESFDVDYETYIWLDNCGHGQNGAPYHIKDILKDMESVEENLHKLWHVYVNM
ncbi:MAG: hypothetical protein Q4A15_01050 [Prevotellaceae bacterium]|nr:hypothetical protein [Prevotellaceae bacterium]